MNKKLLTTLVSAALVQGCIEVDEIENQNQLLEQQNEILSQSNEQKTTSEANPIVLTGVVVDSETELPVTSGTVKIKLGNDWSEAMALVSGTFEIPELPIYSNYDLLFESANNSFVTKVWSGRTTFGELGKPSYTDLGMIKVGAPVEHVLKVTNANTDEHISGLVFTANTSSVYGSYTEKAYEHKSVEDSEAGTYTIVLPANLVFEAYASLDLDNDKVRDFNISSVENNFYHYSEKLAFSVPNGASGNDLEVELVESNLNDDQAPIELEVRFTVIDKEANPIADLAVESDMGQVATYDSETMQYSMPIELKANGSLSLLIPSFEVGDLIYESSTIRLYSDINSAQIVVSYQNDTNDAYDTKYSNDETSIDVAIEPRSSTKLAESLQIITRQKELVSPTYSYKVFYANRVELLEDSVKLLKTDVLKKVLGNELSTDFIPDGTTRFTLETEAVASTASLSANNTLVTVAPDSELDAYSSYEYVFGKMKIKGTDLELENSNANRQFVTESSTLAEFDINDIKLDNNNYRADGEIILTENSANETVTYAPTSSSVTVFLPGSIVNLESLELRAVSKTEDGNLESYTQNVTIVSNGGIYAHQRYVSSAAYNENIINNTSRSIYFGTALPDDYLYSTNLYEYMADDTNIAENNITFEYSYETKSGVTEEGVITLPIL